MKWAAHAIKDIWSGSSGKPVVVPFDKLSKVITPKGGNCCVVIAAPGVGKTTFMLNWVTESDMRVLYVSSDTSPHDLTTQLGALSTNDERAKVEQRLVKSGTWREEYARHISEQFSNLVLDFTPSPSMTQIREMCEALTELWGAAPDMVVMDTASNVEMSDMSNNAEWQRVWLEAIAIARDYNLFFVFAHHVKQGLARTGKQAPELSDGLWGSDQFPEFVLALHQPRPRTLTLTVRKNRTGRRDVPVHFDVDYAYAKVEEEVNEDNG